MRHKPEPLYDGWDPSWEFIHEASEPFGLLPVIEPFPMDLDDFLYPFVKHLAQFAKRVGVASIPCKILAYSSK